MITVAEARIWVRRLATVALQAWRYDLVFRWAVLVGSAALAVLLFDLANYPGARPEPGTAVLSGPVLPEPRPHVSAPTATPALPSGTSGKSHGNTPI
jgi:hypothetical protein